MPSATVFERTESHATPPRVTTAESVTTRDECAPVPLQGRRNRQSRAASLRSGCSDRPTAGPHLPGTAQTTRSGARHSDRRRQPQLTSLPREAHSDGSERRRDQHAGHEPEPDRIARGRPRPDDEERDAEQVSRVARSSRGTTRRPPTHTTAMTPTTTSPDGLSPDIPVPTAVVSASWTRSPSDIPAFARRARHPRPTEIGADRQLLEDAYPRPTPSPHRPTRGRRFQSVERIVVRGPAW